MTDISLASTLAVTDDAVFRELGGEAVILNLETGTYFGLDEVGTRIWRLIEQHGQLAAVRDAILDEYDAQPEAVERDLLALAAELRAKGLVRVAA